MFESSGFRMQPGQRHGNESVDSSLGRHATGSSKRVDAVRRKLVSRNVVPEVAGLRSLGHYVPDHLAELLMRLS
jgi:hypothetical protein